MGQAKRNRDAGLLQFKNKDGNTIIVANNLIDFKDINKGYEPFRAALSTLGFDWKKASKNGLLGEMILMTNPNKEPAHQIVFEMKANEKMVNGGEAIEFAIISGVWRGISKTIDQVSEGLGCKTVCCSLMLRGNTLSFCIIPF